MNVTFLIGNGFDINLGMKTKYTEFYEYYLEKNKDYNDIIIDKLKKIKNGEVLSGNWADLELLLGEIVEGLNEHEIQEFLLSKEKLEDALIEYLNIEQKKFDFNYLEIAKEFKQKILNVYSDFNGREKSIYKNFISSINEPINYCFVTFNYTEVLDIIIKNTTKIGFINHISKNNHGIGTSYNDVLKESLHIHGSLQSDFVLGVDSVNQINNDIMINNSECKELMIKPLANEILGEDVPSVFRNIINNSRYIFIYGLSIGLTDQTWWKSIMNWLTKSKLNRLVIYDYRENYSVVGATRKIRHRNEICTLFKTRSECADKVYEQIKDQIIVVLNSEIFSYNKILIKQINR